MDPTWIPDSLDPKRISLHWLAMGIGRHLQRTLLVPLEVARWPPLQLREQDPQDPPPIGRIDEIPQQLDVTKAGERDPIRQGSGPWDLVGIRAAPPLCPLVLTA